jgi:rSAM/selenodomain-associated transferase 2
MLTSVIIPTLNEARVIGAAARSLADLRGAFEVIVADGGSADATVEIARARGLRVVAAPRGRGVQMNAGAHAARGDVLLFLHADTRLPADALELVERALSAPEVCGGHFNLRFDGETREAKLLTRLYPRLRPFGLCYGDSAIFVRRGVFEAVGGYREVALFEDCELYRRLRRAGRFARLERQAVTSSRRFEGRFARTFALWASLQALYWLGVPPNLLARAYKPAR